MIPITPLAGSRVLVNVRLIEQIEETPETVIVLTGGRRMVVVDVAQNLVERINRVQGNVRAAMAVRSSHTTKATRLSVVGPPPPETETGLGFTTPNFSGTASTDVSQPISTVNLFHAGQIAIDRALAAIARHEWASTQGSVDTDQVAQHQLATAHDTICGLTRTIDLEQSGDVAKSLVDILNYCSDQLADMRTAAGEATPPRERKAMLHLVKANLAKLRKTWARIAADASSPASSCARA